MREIPSDNLEGLEVPDAVLLCRRGDSWVAEKDGSRAGDFVSSLVGDSERLYPEPNGQLVLSDDGGRTASARISAIPSSLFSITEKVRELRNIPSEKSYEMLLGKAVESHKLINLAPSRSRCPQGCRGGTYPNRQAYSLGTWPGTDGRARQRHRCELGTRGGFTNRRPITLSGCRNSERADR